jgi:ectoine hydroxylase-related dioxygenase (phytanoyl-CoA dioxygenase family)
MHWKTNPLATRSKELKGTELGGAMEQMSRFAARQSYRVHEKNISNPEGRAKFAEHTPALDGEQQKVMSGLDDQGYAVVPITEFLPEAGDTTWARLRADGERFKERCDAEVEKRRAKEEARAKKGKAPKGLGKGDYIIRSLGKEVPALGLDDPWLKIGVSDRVLDVVNSYFGLWSKLTYVDLWYTPPAQQGVERVSSQRWHRDYNDDRLVKVFIYLTDINEDTGPLEYVPGSALGGEYGNVWPWRPLSNDLYPSEEFDERIPKSAQMALTGPEGSVIFCNTSGFHRGGYATGTRPRVMAVYNYSSPASLATLTLRNFKPDVSQDGLSEQAAYALN